MSRCEYLDTKKIPICKKKIYVYGGHHCRHCNKFLCDEHTEGFGEQKYCKNKTCYTPEEAAQFSLDNMSNLHRKSQKFQGKPIFPVPSSDAEKSDKEKHSHRAAFSPLRFFTFIGLMSIILNIYFPQRIEYLDHNLQQAVDSLELYLSVYGYNDYLMYAFQLCRIVYIWLLFILILIYLFFKSL
jgi:hypothetical protein